MLHGANIAILDDDKNDDDDDDDDEKFINESLHKTHKLQWFLCDVQ